MGILEKLLQDMQNIPEDQAKIGLSSYYANQAGDIDGTVNSDYSQAMQYQNMVRQLNQPKEVLQYNDIPLDNEYESYGGRISSTIPLDIQKSINLGLTGQGFNSPNYTESFRPTAIDATYQTGSTGYGLSYEQLSPEQKQLLFSIFKEF